MSECTGRYHDGKTAISHTVMVRPNAAALDIYAEDGALIGQWRLGDIQAEDDPAGGLRLRCGAARLTVAHGAALHPLFPPTARRSVWPWLAAIASTVLAGVTLWFGIPLASRMVARAIPVVVEQKWGDRVANRLEQQWGLCSAAPGKAALSELTASLAGGLLPTQRPRRVSVVKLDAVNAIALPGGRIIIFQGLLAQAKSADEVAGVLAHEMTHVAQRHATAAMIRAFGIGALITLVTGDASGAMGTGLVMALSGAYSREDEDSADQGAAILLNHAQMGTNGMVEFFRRLDKQSNLLPEWLSTHPDSLARAQKLETLAPATGRPALSAERWAELQGICR